MVKRGETFLQHLARRIEAEADVGQWWGRFSAAFDALDLVGAVDAGTATSIGEQIRSSLAAKTGQDVAAFHLASRHRVSKGDRRHYRGPRPNPVGFMVRTAWAELPPAATSGAVNFLSCHDGKASLVFSGKGTPPWPQRDAPVLMVDSQRANAAAVFKRVVDNQGRKYRLRHASSSASTSASGLGRRWELRGEIEPVPPDDVQQLTFEMATGEVTAPLLAAAEVQVAAGQRDWDLVEQYLLWHIHNQVWLHLLQPSRQLPQLSVIADALVAVGAVADTNRAVKSVSAVDAAIAGGDTSGLPLAAARALSGSGAEPWVGCTALGIVITHSDVGPMGLEALVGHPDRTALYLFGSPQATFGAESLVVSALDDKGGGYVCGLELLGGPSCGVLHFRPGLNADAKRLTIRMEGRSAWAAIDIDLAVRVPGP